MPMNVLLLSHEPLLPPTGGGSSEAVYLVEELLNRGHRVVFAGPLHPGTSTDDIQEKLPIEIHPFTAWGMGRYTSLRTVKYLLYPWFLARLVRRILRQNACDVIVSQHAISSVAAGWVHRRTQVPVVMNFLDFLTGFMESWPWWKMPRPLLRVLNRFELSMPCRYGADGVLTVSDSLRNRFMASGYPGERCRTMYFGFDSRLFPFAPRPGPQAAEHRECILAMHGSMDTHHIGPILEGAIHSLALSGAAAGAGGFRFRLRFIGKVTPALQSFLNRAEKAGLSQYLECTGFIPYERIAAALEDVHIGLVPYESSEGSHCAFVAKAIEYLACGIPVVSTPLEGLKAGFHDSPGIRFSEFDSQSLSSAILSLWENYPSTEELADISRTIHRDFDWRVLCRNAVDFIESRYKESASASTSGSR